jgi:hypothetical protein
MAEDNDYEVKAVEKKAEAVEAIVDQKIQEKPSKPLQPSQAPTRKGFSIPQIPTDKIFKTLTDREMMRQTLHDETMEPHVHLVILLFIVFVLAIIIALLGI